MSSSPDIKEFVPPMDDFYGRIIKVDDDAWFTAKNADGQVRTLKANVEEAFSLLGRTAMFIRRRPADSGAKGFSEQGGVLKIWFIHEFFALSPSRQ